MLLTIDGHRRIERVLSLLGCKLRVWLDDEDVTEQCFVADEQQGYIGRYLRDDDGRRFINKQKHCAAAELVTGRVSYVITASNGRRVQAVMTADGGEGVDADGWTHRSEASACR